MEARLGANIRKRAFGSCDLIGGQALTHHVAADDVVIDPTNPMNVYVAN